MKFPFEASCIKKIKSSPLNEGEKVTVLEMTDEGDLKDIYVNIQWKDRSFSVPLEQLHPLDVDEQTVEAVGRLAILGRLRISILRRDRG